MMTEKFNIGVHRKIQFLGDGVGVWGGGGCVSRKKHRGYIGRYRYRGLPKNGGLDSLQI